MTSKSTDPTVERDISDTEIGEMMKKALGLSVATMIIQNPIVALGAINGALAAMLHLPDADENGLKPSRVKRAISALQLSGRRAVDLSAFPDHPVNQNSETHSTGDASIHDVLPDGETIDLAPFMLTGSFEDIWPGVDLLTTEKAAKRLGIVVSTLHEWCKAGTLLRLSRKGKRGFRIPSELIVGKKKIVPGLALVIEKIGHGSHNLAWRFLTDQIEFEDGVARPLDLLKAGRVDEVLAQERRWGEQGGS